MRSTFRTIMAFCLGFVGARLYSIHLYVHLTVLVIGAIAAFIYANTED